MVLKDDGRKKDPSRLWRAIWMALPLLVVAGAIVAPACAGTEAPSDPATAEEPPLVQEADLDAPVEEVWKVFSTAEGWKKLGPALASVDFRIGGKILSRYDPNGVLGDDGTIENTIMAYEPMRMVAFRISKPPKQFPYPDAWRDTWSVATLTDLGGGRTHLRFAMMGYTATPQSREMRAFFDRGNTWVMKHLKQTLEAGRTPDSPVPESTPR